MLFIALTMSAEKDIMLYIKHYNYHRGHSYNNYLSPASAEAGGIKIYECVQIYLTTTNLEGASGSSATVIQTETDHDAIDKSFDFGEDALDSIDRTIDRSLDTVDESVDRTFDFGDLSQIRSFNFGEDVLNESQETTRQALNVASNAQVR